MKFDEITRQSLLYDFYGELLTERQKEVMELYNGENLSLAEIAEEFGISRQGVHDALHKAQKALEDYERKLGLVERFSSTREAISNISNELDKTIREIDGAATAKADGGAAAKADNSVTKQLKSIQSEIERLEI